MPRKDAYAMEFGDNAPEGSSTRAHCQHASPNLREKHIVIEVGQVSVDLLTAVAAVQRQFIAEPESEPAFTRAMQWLVEVTESESGFIGEVLSSLQEEPLFAFHAVLGARWDKVTRTNGEDAPDRQSNREVNRLALEVLRSDSVVFLKSPPHEPDCNGTPRAALPLESFCGVPLRDGNGAVVGVLGLAHRRGSFDDEIAARLQLMCDTLGIMIAATRRERERRLGEAALRTSEARHRVFADHVTDGLFLQDAESRVVDVNRRGCESLGYEREELLGMTPADFNSAITAAEIREYSARLAAGESIAFDSRHRRKDGSDFPVEIRIRPVWIDGKLHSLALVCDITDRKRAEERLYESEQRLQLALRASRMGVWEWDIDTDAVYLSPECNEIYGNAELDGTGQAFNKLIHPDDLPRLREKEMQLLKSGTFDYWEFRFLSPDRGTRWVANWAVVRRDAAGKALKMTGTARDITEQKLGEETLRQSTLLLEKVVENIPLAVFVKDPLDSFRIRLWNKGAESIFGITREEMIGRTAHDFWPKEQAEFYESIDQRVIDEGVLQDIAEVSSFHRSGKPMVIHTRKLPLFDREGKPTLLLAICDDITERKRSDEALRQAQQRLAITLRGADVGLWDWDLVTDEVIFSEEWKSQLGYHGDEIRNHEIEWESRVHPDDFAQAQQNIKAAIEASSGEYRSEFRMQHKDGSWRWILSRGSVINNADGKPVRMLGVHIDITDRKRAEEALQASESRYRYFVDHATDALFLHDHTGRVLDVNQQACTSLGYERDELIGMMPKDFDPDISPESVATTLRRLDAGETVAFDSHHRRKDGASFPVEVRLRPFSINNERFHIGLVRDITERKRVEQALRESEARLRTLLENLDKVAVQAYEPDGTITFWNRASEMFYGYSAAEAIGRDLVELLHADHTRGLERRIMAESLRTGKPPGAEEVEVVRRDGSKITVFASRVVHPRPGKQPEFFCFDVDITDRKRAEEELARRQNELLHASRLSTVGQMVAEISHEVAQPLNAIGNFAAASERILDTGIDGQLDTLHEYVRAILKQNERCVAILDRLRDFSRRAPGSPSACDVAELLQESVELISHDLRRNHVQVHFDLADKLPPVIGDRIQLQQLMVNLLNNARDAMQEQPKNRRKISVRAITVESSIVFEIIDQGTGLSDDAAIHLFDPFYTTKEHGMGLGLSICQSIVKDQGGKLDVIKNQDGGATFRVRLPLSGKRRS